MERFSAEEFDSVEGDHPWCVFDHEAEWVCARFNTEEDAQECAKALSNLYFAIFEELKA